MLRIERVNAFYGKSHVLWDVSLEVKPGEVVGLLGRNGVGKTTLLRTVMGYVTSRSGRICYQDADLLPLRPHKIPSLGIAYVPQERPIYAEFTVMDNLRMGCLHGEPSSSELSRALEYFPRLAERKRQIAGSLSGGERQMLAIARAIIKKPKLILLDEPTEGLMPSLVEAVERTLKSFAQEGIGILLVEQSLAMALNVCNRIAVMEKGTIKYDEPVGASSGDLVAQHLGLRHPSTARPVVHSTRTDELVRVAAKWD